MTVQLREGQTRPSALRCVAASTTSIGALPSASPLLMRCVCAPPSQLAITWMSPPERPAVSCELLPEPSPAEAGVALVEQETIEKVAITFGDGKSASGFTQFGEHFGGWPFNGRSPHNRADGNDRTRQILQHRANRIDVPVPVAAVGGEDLLPMGLGWVGQHRGTRHLAARASRGRDSHQGQHRSRHRVLAKVVLELAAMP